MIRRFAVTITGCIAALALAACGSATPSASSTSTSSDASTTAATTAGGCIQPGKPPTDSPALAITPGANYTATMETTEGTIVIALNACTQVWGANNFIVLSRKGFYNNTKIHRVAKDFVIQGGDPKGNGTGGPGYDFVSEVPATKYEVGDIAWAKTGAAPPGSAGSQWFIISSESALQTFNRQPYLYGQFGRVTTGMDVVRKIDALASPEGDGSPTKTVTVKTVTITGP